MYYKMRVLCVLIVSIEEKDEFVIDGKRKGETLKYV